MTNILCCVGELAEVRQLGGGCERGGARVQLRLQAARVQSDQVHEENENTCLVWQFQITVSHFSVCCRYQNMLILCVALLWLLLLPLYWIWKGRKVGGQTSDSIWRIKLFSTSYNIFLNKSATHFLLLIFLDIFSCRRWQDVNVWILRIENVSRADAGIYQCQVTSYLHFQHSRLQGGGEA